MTRGLDDRLAKALKIDRQTLFVGWSNVDPETAPIFDKHEQAIRSLAGHLRAEEAAHGDRRIESEVEFPNDAKFRDAIRSFSDHLQGSDLEELYKNAEAIFRRCAEESKTMIARSRADGLPVEAAVRNLPDRLKARKT
jgi:hypothetical protein